LRYLEACSQEEGLAPAGVVVMARSLLLTALLLISVENCWGQNTRVKASNFTGQITGLRTVKVLPYTGEPSVTQIANIAFDDQFAYLSTPDGLFRTSRNITADSPVTFLGFANYRILNLKVHRNVLYVMKIGGDPRSSTLDAHSFLKSADRGQTFIPLDEGLKYCFRDFCEYLHTTNVFFNDDAMFITAGGSNNLFVTKDEGKNWTILEGRLEHMICYDASVEIIGKKVLFGGECPLDFAYLLVGTLRDDLLGWADGGSPRQVMGLEQMQNRNVQFIQHSDNTPFALVGVEGGLLKTKDLGESYEFKLKFPESGTPNFPYIHEISRAGRFNDFFMAGGLDKQGDRGYLAYSTDHAETWTDISHMILTSEYSAWDVAFIHEDPAGRILIGIPKKDEKKLLILEALITAPVILLTHGEPQRAIALDSVTLFAGPFDVLNPHNFSTDRKTRVSLFATNIAPADENTAAITAHAEDAQNKVHSLPVEFVGRTPGYAWITQIVARIPDELAKSGDVKVSVAVRGVASNKAVVTLK
jgi:hypothetical protein